MAKCPEGIATEIIRTDALEEALEKAGDIDIEFPCYRLKNDNFKYIVMVIFL